eukprot:scaffold34582_cov160-Amphora_coffeaeformis.AAC.1
MVEKELNPVQRYRARQKRLKENLPLSPNCVIRKTGRPLLPVELLTPTTIRKRRQTARKRNEKQQAATMSASFHYEFLGAATEPVRDTRSEEQQKLATLNVFRNIAEMDSERRLLAEQNAGKQADIRLLAEQNAGKQNDALNRLVEILTPKNKEKASSDDEELNARARHGTKAAATETPSKKADARKTPMMNPTKDSDVEEFSDEEEMEVSDEDSVEVVEEPKTKAVAKVAKVASSKKATIAKVQKKPPPGSAKKPPTRTTRASRARAASTPPSPTLFELQTMDAVELREELNKGSALVNLNQEDLFKVVLACHEKKLFQAACNGKTRVGEKLTISSLRIMCKGLGIDSTGPDKFLARRLLDYVE